MPTWDRWSPRRREWLIGVGKQAIDFWTQTKTVTARWYETESVSRGINNTISLH